MHDIKMLKAKKLAELYEIAEQIGIENLKGLKKQQVIDKILDSSKEKRSDDLDSESKISKNNLVNVTKNEGEEEKAPKPQV